MSFILGVSFLILSLFAIWLIIVSLFAMIWPQKALDALAKFASTKLIHFTELSLRFLVGIAFLGASPFVDFSRYYRWIGIFLMISSALIMILPHQWHHAYAKFWANSIPPALIRSAMPISLIAGAILLWTLY